MGIIETLTSLGVNAYEAKSYVALLTLGSGGGYAVAKQAGIPTSKVYGALSSLALKGFIVSDGMTKPRYTPVPPEKIIGRIRDGINRKVETLIPELQKISPLTEEHGIRSLKGPKAVYSQISNLITNAEKKIFMTAWPVDLEIFRPDLEARVETCQVKILANGKFKLKNSEIFFHRRTDMLKRYIPGRWLLAVSGQGEGAAASFDNSGGAHCVWTDNPGISRIFHDHILHDISLNYVISKLPEEQKPVIEEELHNLRMKLSLT